MSWPSALLPGVLLMALLSVGAGSVNAGVTDPDTSGAGVTDLRVVDAR